MDNILTYILLIFLVLFIYYIYTERYANKNTESMKFIFDKPYSPRMHLKSDEPIKGYDNKENKFEVYDEFTCDNYMKPIQFSSVADVSKNTSEFLKNIVMGGKFLEEHNDDVIMDTKQYQNNYLDFYDQINHNSSFIADPVDKMNELIYNSTNELHLKNNIPLEELYNDITTQ